jgi:hypothetical protein
MGESDQNGDSAACRCLTHFVGCTAPKWGFDTDPEVGGTPQRERRIFPSGGGCDSGEEDEDEEEEEAGGANRPGQPPNGRGRTTNPPQVSLVASSYGCYVMLPPLDDSCVPFVGT